MVSLLDTIAGIEQPKEPTTLDRVMRGIGGFGAGLQGRGGEYLDRLQAGREAEEAYMQKRRMAGLQDMMTTKKLLQGGDYNNARKLLENRVDLIRKQGQDPKDTLEFMAQLESDPAAAMEQLNLIEQMAIERGMLKPPPAPERIFDKDTGQVITLNPDGTASAMRPEGYQMPEPDELERAQIEKYRAEVRNMGREKATTRMREAVAAGLQPGTPEYRDFMLRDTSTKINVERPLTEMQSKIALFSSMMQQTQPTIDKLESELTSSEIWSQAAGDSAAANSLLKTPKMRQYQAAGRQWSEGMLRLQTGAAATQDEIDRQFKTYFPQPGDDAETINFKKLLRNNAAQAVKQAGGDVTSNWSPEAGTTQGVSAPAAPQFTQDQIEAEIRRRGLGG